MHGLLTDYGNVQASQQWAINGGPPLGQQWWGHNWPILHFSGGPALAVCDGAVM